MKKQLDAPSECQAVLLLWVELASIRLFPIPKKMNAFQNTKRNPVDKVSRHIPFGLNTQKIKTN